MKRLNKKILLAIIGILFSTILSAQNIYLNPNISANIDNRVFCFINPLLEYGNLRSGSGLITGLNYKDTFTSNIDFNIGAITSLRHDEFGLGIPGVKNTISLMTGFALGL